MSPDPPIQSPPPARGPRPPALAAAVALAAAGPSSAATPPARHRDLSVSATRIDKVDNTVTLPLYRGRAPGRGATWVVITESSDLRGAVRLGVDWAPTLAKRARNARRPAGRGRGRRTSARPALAGGVRCRCRPQGQAVRRARARAVPLDPLDPSTHAGPIGDPGCSPPFTLDGRTVSNGPQVANRSGRHATARSLDVRLRRVSTRMTSGFCLGRAVRSLSTDASVTRIAALEYATNAPDVAAAATAGNDDPSVCAREPIIPVVNGPRGVHNPQRQGRQSAVAGQGDPLNTLREEPARTRARRRTAPRWSAPRCATSIRWPGHRPRSLPVYGCG